MRIRQGTTDKAISFVAVDEDDLRTRETGLTSFTVYYAKDGGTDVVMTTPTTTEIDATNMPGLYWLDIDESGMTSLTAGDDTAEVVLHITKTGMAPVSRVYEIYREETTAGETLLVDSSGRTDVGRWLGNAVTASSGNPDINVESIDASAITATSIASNAITAAKIAASALDGKGDWNTTTPPTAAAVADAVWDEDATGHQTQGTFGQAIGDPGADADTIWGLVNTNLNATVSSRSSHSAADVWTAGTRTLTGAVTVSAINANVITAASIAASALDGKGDWNIGKTGYSLTQAFPSNFADLDITVTTGRIDVGNWLGNAVTAGVGNRPAVDAEAISGSVTAADDVQLQINNLDVLVSSRSTVTTAEVNTEVDNALVTYGLDHLVQAAVVGADVTDNSIIARLVSSSATADWDSYVNTTDSLQAIADSGGGGPTAAQIADAVWDEDATAHQTLGTFGQAIGDPGADSDSIWALVNTNLDATISSRSTVTTAEVNTEVDNAIVTYGLDHLVQTSVIGTDIADNSIIARLVSSSATADWDSYVNTTDSLQAIADSGGGGPTAAQIADAVWDEATAGHTTGGTFGEQCATDIDAILADTNELQTDWANGGRLDLILDDAATSATPANVREECGNALVDIRLDHLMVLAVTGADVVDNSVVAQLVSKSATADWDSFDNTTDSLEAIADTSGGDATAANQSTIITHLTDIKGGTFSGATDSLEAIRDRGDAAWITATGFSTHSAADVWSVVTRTLTGAVTVGTMNSNTITAAAIAAGALDGKGDWNVGKTGYSLTQAFPTNFADLAISATTGRIDVGQWLGNAVTFGVGGPDVNVNALADNTAAAILQREYAKSIIQGECQTGTLSQIQASTDLTGYLAGELADGVIVWIDGTASGQRSTIVTNDGAGLITFEAVTTAPANGDSFVIYGALTRAAVVNEVNTALDTAISELGVGIPTATPTLRTGLMLMYMALRNQLDVSTSGADILGVYNDAGTLIASKALSDDTADYSEAKMISG